MSKQSPTTKMIESLEKNARALAGMDVRIIREMLESTDPHEAAQAHEIIAAAKTALKRLDAFKFCVIESHQRHVNAQRLAGPRNG